MIADIDPVSLLCDLMEASFDSFEAGALPGHWGESMEFLSGIGAVKKANRLSVLTCRACDNDHPVHLEFDPGTRRYWYFCREAGRVMVEDEDNDTATIQADPEWLVDWLVTALPITPPVRQRVLVPDRAWRLGEMHLGGSELTIAFSIGTSLHRNLDELAAALATVPPTGLGLVLTTTDSPPRWLTLPHGYRLVELREIARAKSNRLEIDRPRMLSWIKGLRKGLDRPVRLRAGRPSAVDLVNEISDERRARGLSLINQRTEAREIQTEIASRRQDRKLPSVKTIERHLRQLRLSDATLARPTQR